MSSSGTWYRASWTRSTFVKSADNDFVPVVRLGFFLAIVRPAGGEYSGSVRSVSEESGSNGLSLSVSMGEVQEDSLVIPWLLALGDRRPRMANRFRRTCERTASELETF